MKLGLSTLWTEEPTAQAGDRTRLFAAHLSQVGATERAAGAAAPTDRTGAPAARKRRTSKPPRASRPASVA